MNYLVDTNILIRLVHRSDPMHPTVVDAYTTLRNQEQVPCVVPQNFVEFWSVATRPSAVNGLGLSIEEATQELIILKQLFYLQLDIPRIFSLWENLIYAHQVIGKQVHDTRLVAAMMAHNLTHLLTLNPDDFRRFSEITVVTPNDILFIS